MYRVWDFVTYYALLLIAGAAIALVWANIGANSYHDFVELVIVDDFIIGHPHLDENGTVHRTLTLHYLVNNVLMAPFFAMAAKEVWEAIVLKNGALRGKKALTPLFATAGGMIGPVAVYLGLAAVLGSDLYDAVARGWAIPAATDIAFSYLVGRFVFGAGHPAVRFLLLLAIADDAAALVILTVFYSSADVGLEWLLLSLIAAVAVYLLFNWLPRRLDRGNQLRPTSTWVRRVLGFWPYLIAACLSWYGFQQAGLHPALGLLPIVPTIPHADRAFGIFAEAEVHLHDLLNEMEHRLKYPVAFILFLFGLCNAGVEFATIGAPTLLVFAGLIIGKPIGVLIFGWVAARPLGLGLPPGMRIADLVVIGCIAAIGFTVSLLMAAAAFEGGALEDAAKLGAIFSGVAAVVAIVAGRLLRVQRRSI